MGMYTICEGDFTMKPETPDHIWEALEWLTNFDDGKPANQLDHPLFRSERHHNMLHCAGGSGSDEYTARALVDRAARAFKVGFELKNYDSEIDKLIDFISPWVESAVDAYTKYEEFDHYTPIDLPCANVLTLDRKIEAEADDYPDYPGLFAPGFIDNCLSGHGQTAWQTAQLLSHSLVAGLPGFPMGGFKTYARPNKPKNKRTKAKSARKARRKNRK